MAVRRELTNRGIDLATETGQEVLQEGSTIAGTQLGSKLDTDEFAYSFGEVTNRLWDTAKESALTYGLMNVPSTVYNTHVQNQSHLAAEQQRSQLIAKGEQRILSGEMPTDAQLAAMKLDKAEVLDDLISYWLGGMDETELQKKVEQYSQVQYHEDGTVVVTDDWTGRNHPHLPQKYIPNAVIDTLSQNGRQHDRTFFNSTGLQDRQVSNGGHSNRKQHPYGINGEHAHDILWEDGGIIGRPHRELINFEREENSDIL